MVVIACTTYFYVIKFCISPYTVCVFFTSVRINSGFSHICNIIQLVFVINLLKPTGYAMHQQV